MEGGAGGRRDATLAGRRLGTYELEALIGAGGMGEVYRAHDTKLGRDVAIKVLPAFSFTDATARARLVREARTASKLNHPNICTVHDVGEADGHVFIAMELVDGESLSARLASGALPVEDALRYGLQLADALSHAHERGVIHRDLKSANIIVRPEGRIKVLDFGLAKILGAEPTSVTTQESLSIPGTIAGTIAYMAPEQLRGVMADARGDIWALGVVLFEILAGRRPFEGQTDFALSSAILSQPPAELPHDLPSQLKAIVVRCLAKDPEQRYQKSADIGAALEAFRADPAARPVPAGFLGLRRWLVAALSVAVGAAALAGFITGAWRRPEGPAAPPNAVVKLAVLPFANLTGDPEQEYFSDGLTEEMIAQLGRLHPQGLTVIARTSVMRYKNTDKSIDQIGGELGVEYILEGSARREGGRVRITTELIRVRDQTLVWADSAERELAGILALQSDVARGVAGSLAFTLLPAEQARLASSRPVNPEAYDAYLKGLQHWYRLTPPELEAAQQYFELALQKDPDYALAHAGIAALWIARAQMGSVSPAEASPRIRTAALKALELDATLAEPHMWLATVRGWYEYDWAGSDAEYKRAIESNPSSPDPRAMYSHFLCTMKRPDEAFAQIERALELDPFNAFFRALYAVVLQYARRNDEAIAQIKRALSTSPDLPFARGTLWEVLHTTGRDQESLPELKMWVGAPDPEFDAALARGQSEAGYRGAMVRGAETLAQRTGARFVSPFLIAEMYAFADERDRAFEWLEKSFKIRDPNLPYIRWPNWDNLHGDPRYRDLLRRMNLPQ